MGCGKDYTLFAKRDGYVHFTWNPFNKKQVGAADFAYNIDYFDY